MDASKNTKVIIQDLTKILLIPYKVIGSISNGQGSYFNYQNTQCCGLEEGIQWNVDRPL